jgi:hypothetical protein
MSKLTKEEAIKRAIEREQRIEKNKGLTDAMSIIAFFLGMFILIMTLLG